MILVFLNKVQNVCNRVFYSNLLQTDLSLLMLAARKLGNKSFEVFLVLIEAKDGHKRFEK